MRGLASAVVRRLASAVVQRFARSGDARTPLTAGPDTVPPMTARSRHGVPQRWWRAPVLPGWPRRRTLLAMAIAGVLALLLGSAAGAGLRAATHHTPSVQRTAVGPLHIHLPEDLGPWTKVPASSFASIRGSDALGGAVIDGAWGEMAPGAVLVTVLRAASGTHAGVASVRDSIPAADGITWDGGRDHAAGQQVSGGVRELMLAVESGDGDLVIVSVSAPEDAFTSGTLLEAFRTSSVD